MLIALANAEPEELVADPWAAIDDMAAAAGRRGALVLVLPELALNGSIALSRAAAVAEPSDGPAALRMQGIAKAHRVAILAGYAEACSGRVYSSALLVDETGMATANYRRTHITMDEDEQISRGHWLTMMKLGDCRVGIIIGYDLLFPEVVRGLVLSGAAVILGLGSADPAMSASAARLLPARAFENEVPVAWSAWRSGDGSTTALVDATGATVEPRPGASVEETPALLIAETDQLAPSTSLRMDRRPRLYQRLTTLDGVDAPGRAV